MPATDHQALIDLLIRETSADSGRRSDVSILVAAALLAAASPDLLATAMQSATTTADRQFVAIATAHVAGDHDRVDALARDHLLDHAARPVLRWIVDRSLQTTTDQGAQP